MRQVMHMDGTTCATVCTMKHPATSGLARLPLMLIVLVATVGSPAASAAAEKRAPTHEDIWLMKRVGAPQVSPDGHWIVVSVIEPAYDENQQLSDLWLI